MTKQPKNVFSHAMTAFAFSSATLLIILLASAWFIFSSKEEPAPAVKPTEAEEPIPPTLQTEGLSEPAQVFLKTLIHIAQGNAKAAAPCINYPIDRPHPLSPIDCEETFIRTFPILFDEGTRAKIAEALQAGEVPEQVGWRGYLFLNGELWADEASGKLYVINSTSAAERELMQQQTRDEVDTLHPDLQANLLDTVLTFVSEEKGLYGRIDLLTTEDDAGRDQYRVAVFSMDMSPNGLPKYTFICKEVVEGTACNVSYQLPDETAVFYVTRAGHLETPPYQLDLPTENGVEEIPVELFPWPVKR